jgi:hypothetical protein
MESLHGIKGGIHSTLDTMKTVIYILLLIFINDVYCYSSGGTDQSTTTCAVGMSSTTSGCTCLAGYVNKTDGSPGCSACPAGTHTLVITPTAGITNNVMKDLLMTRFMQGMVGIQEGTGMALTTEQKKVIQDGMMQSLSDIGDVGVRAQFFEVFESSHMCAKCGTNTYSSNAATSCDPCQMYSSSVNGSSVCHCEAGFDHGIGGVCKECSNCTKDIQFDVTLEMDEIDFVDAQRDKYKDAVAQALALKTSNVMIEHVKVKVAMRRLLASESQIVASTIVVVSNGALDDVTNQIRDGVIIPALSMHGITATSVSSPKIIDHNNKDENVPFPMWFIIGLAALGLLLLFATSVLCMKFALRHKKDAPTYRGEVNMSEYTSTKTTDVNTDATEIYNTSLQIDGFMQNLHLGHTKPELRETVILSRPRFWGF